PGSSVPVTTTTSVPARVIGSMSANPSPYGPRSRARRSSFGFRRRTLLIRGPDEVLPGSSMRSVACPTALSAISSDWANSWWSSTMTTVASGAGNGELLAHHHPQGSGHRQHHGGPRRRLVELEPAAQPGGQSGSRRKADPAAVGAGAAHAPLEQ